MNDYEYKSLRDVQTSSNVKDALEHSRRTRGKSARAIEFQLEAQALQNLSESRKLSEMRRFHENAMHVMYDETSHSEHTTSRSRLLESEKLMEPLYDLRHELKSIEQKTNSYASDSRR